MRDRRSARLVVLNECDELFLFHCREGEHATLREFWMTPGGGVEDGETWEQAALRELWEETGIDGVVLGPLLWTKKRVSTLAGEEMRSVERYYLLRVSGVVISTANQYAYEREVYRHHRWWPLAALRATDEVVFPEGLAGYLEPVLAGTIPSAPVDISLR